MTSLRTLDSALVGCTIVIAADRRPAGVATALERRGATVQRVSVLAVSGDHRDPTPDAELIRRSARHAASGEADAVLFASAPAAVAWTATADHIGAADDIRARAASGRLLLAALGHDTASVVEDAGLRASIADPETPGSLERTVIDHFGGGRAPSTPTDAGRVEVRSGGALVDGEFIPLSRSSAALLEALTAAGGRVLSRADLGRMLPGGDRNGHAVEVAVARLREALGASDFVHTVVKRGYRLAVVDG